MKKIICASVAALLMSGCASIIKGGTQVVKINSTPEGAAISVVNRAGVSVATGSTPASVTLNRSSGYFQGEEYKIKLKKEGFAEKEIVLTSSVGGWYFGNILLGGLIGMLIVDPLTGAMYNLAPESISPALEAMNVKTSAADGSLTVVLAQDVPASVWKNAKELPAKAF
jgi:uncharacterized protein YceK